MKQIKKLLTLLLTAALVLSFCSSMAFADDGTCLPSTVAMSLVSIW